MMRFKSDGSAPGLLVSVRNELEALEALAGGADVIDVKEPTRGSLGAADASTIAEVVYAVNGRAIVTAALGELIEFEFNHASIEGCGMPSPRSGVGMLNWNHAHAAKPREHATHVPLGISLFKFGLAGCREHANWAASWRNAFGRVLGNGHAPLSRPVAVVYADWPAAHAPTPMEILNAAVQFGCPALLVDTWDKSSGSLFDHWPASELNGFADQVRSRDIRLVLAGSLMGAAIAEAARLSPDLIAVRTAACEGGRNGAVSRERVHGLKQWIAASAESSVVAGG
jgi:uncharacterized protein (UPF0264 family)